MKYEIYLNIILLEIHQVGTITETQTGRKLWLYAKQIYLTCSVT